MLGLTQRIQDWPTSYEREFCSRYSRFPGSHFQGRDNIEVVEYKLATTTLLVSLIIAIRVLLDPST